MELKLSHEIVDQIIFGMENQGHRSVFNLETLEVVGEEQTFQSDEENVFIELPDWNSSMGFHLMEKFVANLRNPVYREILRESLAAGKGVFRGFKNALKERKDIERLWFRFKEREMRQYVVDWFTTLQEARDLEHVEVEEEETVELVLSDFSIEYSHDADVSEYEKLDRESYVENFPDLPEEVAMAYHSSLNRSMNCDELIRAETPDGDLAGFLSFSEPDPDLGVSRVIGLFVLREYRGLGLAKAMLEWYLDDSCRRGMEWVFAEISGLALGFTDRLVRNGFDRVSSGLVLDLHRWGTENSYF